MSARLPCRWPLRRLGELLLVHVLAVLAGCEATMPKALAGMPFIGDAAGARPAVSVELAPPKPRNWPDPRVDVLNQRARGYGLVRMPEMQRYLDGLLSRIKEQARVPAWPGKVHVLATPTLEAFVTAAGNVYISMGWLSSAESEDEIMALMSHEFGHVYLHFHQLESAVQDSNQAAELAAMTLALADQPGRSAAWSRVDTLNTSYMLGRDLAVSVWGRAQESAADNLGLNLSLKMGYSYDDGFKALLERLASWEEENGKQQQRLAEQLRNTVGQQAAGKLVNAYVQPNLGPNRAAARPVLAQLIDKLGGLLEQGRRDASDLWQQNTRQHPETLARLDALAGAVADLPPEQVSKPARVQTWKAARGQASTAAILKNYDAAARALQNLDDAQAIALARLGASGPTAQHALPVIALYKATLAQSAMNPTRGQARDAGPLLDGNLASEPDRAWATYVERATQLQATRQQAAAKKVMDQGYAYFADAPEAWPQAIHFYGQTQGWAQAKTMAASCASRFPAIADSCRAAAATPAEQASADRKESQKPGQLMDKVIRK